MLFCRLLPVVIMIAATAMASSFSFVGASEWFRAGDDDGWREPDANRTDMYNLWAGRSRFHVGDTIFFSYKNDSVLEVDKRGYYHCNVTAPIRSFTDGNTTVALDHPGILYFTSGVPGHCKHGQRLIVDVMGPHQPPPPTPPQALAPSPSTVQPSTASSAGLVPLIWAVGRALLAVAVATIRT